MHIQKIAELLYLFALRLIAQYKRAKQLRADLRLHFLFLYHLELCKLL